MANRYYPLLKPIYVMNHSAVVGPKEGQGPYEPYFDEVLTDDKMGMQTYEKAEEGLFRKTLSLTLEKAGVASEDVAFMLGGDLLNQIISANYTARDLKIPFLGLYGACSTMAESLLLGSLLLSGGYGDKAICVTSSHFSTAERQYRFPLELGNQRQPTSQWTVTGSGAVLLTPNGKGAFIDSVTVGRVVDMNITDAANMGAAMAPAAADTIIAHFNESGRNCEDYDLIVTGDLGLIGRSLMDELLKKGGLNVSSQLFDCGCEIYKDLPNMKAGGSGCGCAAVMLCGYLLDKLEKGELHNILFLATGALMSPTASFQGESIPGIAHCITIRGGTA